MKRAIASPNDSGRQPESKHKIKTAVHVTISDIINGTEPNCVSIEHSHEGKVSGLIWPYDTGDESLNGMCKRRGGVWNRSIRMWTFQDEANAVNMLAAIRKRHPRWPIFENRNRDKRKPMSKVQYFCLDLGHGKMACYLPCPLPFSSKIILPNDALCVKLCSDNKRRSIAMIVAKQDEIAEITGALQQQGASETNDLQQCWGLNTDSKIHIKSSGWAVQIQFDLSNPIQFLLAPPQKYRWEGPYPFGVRSAVPWTGEIDTTRKLWPLWMDKIDALDIEREGDDPSVDMIPAAPFNMDIVPGWNQPARNGHSLHQYQKDGVSFCINRGMRALIGDEMGIGKTAQAIAAAEAVEAPRIVIICPANARYVWDSEIEGWGRGGNVQHIGSQLDALDMSARWHVVTFDLLAPRSENWKFLDAIEENSFLEAFPSHKLNVKSGPYPKTLKLSEYSERTPEFRDQERVAAWTRIMRRLKGELAEQILACGPLLVIVDEAHRAKNRDAKRTKVIQKISEKAGQILLLTGTPLRNNEHEAAVLLGFLDAGAARALDKKKGYTIQDIKDYLSYFMIRRTKLEVLPELPPKTRQRIDIDMLDEESLAGYFNWIEYAQKLYLNSQSDGASESNARQLVQGPIEAARAALGMAKIRGGEVADFVLNVVQNKECCVVFCAHRQVSDELALQLRRGGLQAEVLDGRMRAMQRKHLVNRFQDGDLQVLIGGIHSAGEAITLTRSETVVFVEMDWVPSAMLQAEDRIHRTGQKHNCQIIQLVANFSGDNLDEEMISILGSKVERIGVVLDESTTNIVQCAGIKAAVFDRLFRREK